MDNPVKDGIGQGWVKDLLMPVGDRELRGEQAGVK